MLWDRIGFMMFMLIMTDFVVIFDIVMMYIGGNGMTG